MTCSGNAETPIVAASRTCRPGFWLAALALVLTPAANAATPTTQQDSTGGPATATLRVETNLVQIPVLILTREREKLYSPIPSSRFALRLGNGPWIKPRYVRREGEDPLDLAIVLDPRDVEGDILARVSQSIAGLSPSLLSSRDHVSVYVMGCSSLAASEDIPAGSDLLRVAADSALRTWKEARSRHGAPCQVEARLWDTLAYVVRHLADKPGRRTILALTSGEDRKSRYTPDAVASLAQMNGVSLFALKSTMPLNADPLLSTSADGDLAVTTEASGGMTLHRDHQSLDKELQKFILLLRDRYIVEFPRPPHAQSGKVDLLVNVTGADLFIRAAGKGVPLPDPADGSNGVVVVASSNEPVGAAVTPEVSSPVQANAAVAEPGPAVSPAVVKLAVAPELPNDALPPPVTATLTVTARLTVEDVTVTDRRRAPVRGLLQDNFELKEDGRVQRIRHFEENGADSFSASSPLSPAAHAPQVAVGATATNVLLLDEVTTGLSTGLKQSPESLSYARQQAERYLKKLPAGTPVAILELGSSLRVLQEATYDKAALLAAIRGVAYKPVLGAYVTVQAPGAGCQAANQQSQLVVDALDDVAGYLSGIKGRKNVIWFTPGTPWLTNYAQFSRVGCLRDYSLQLQKAYALLNAARVALYPIDPHGLSTDPSLSALAGPTGLAGMQQPSVTPVQEAAAFGGSLQSDHDSLAQIAEATGGTPTFNRNDLDTALGEAIVTGAHYYSLSYVPPFPGFDGKVHSITVTVNLPNLQLQYRRGYVSVNPEAVPASPPARP
jgi:VWFA-related protein